MSPTRIRSSPQDEPQALVASLHALRLLLEGRTLTAQTLTDEVDGERAVNLRRLQALARHLQSYVMCEGGGRGRRQLFRWVWPTERQVRAECVSTLAIARTLLGTLHESVVGETLSELLEDQARRMDRGPIGDLDRRFFAVHTLAAPTNLDRNVLDAAVQAVMAGRLLRFRYTHFDGTQEGVAVQPWTLVLAEGGPYLYGQCVDCEQPQHLKTTRVFNLVRAARPRLGDTFAFPTREQYDPARTFGHSFGIMLGQDGAEAAEVVLRFDPSMQPWVTQHRLHPSQVGSPEPLPDGGSRVVLRLHVTYDLVRWVRGHGKTVHVEAPANLRDWVVSGLGGQEGCQRFIQPSPGTHGAGASSGRAAVPPNAQCRSAS